MRSIFAVAMASISVLFLGSENAFAFPELVRHNYVNCISCHVSPTGGGVLNPYGRESSRTILSTWGINNEKESKFAYNLIRPPEWIDAMGMYRGVYAYQKTPFSEQGQYIYMQGDFEAAIHNPQWFADATIGYQNPPNAQDGWDHVISRRHYLGFRPFEEGSLRFGRFYPSFGIGLPDHVIPTKRDLGWDEGSETYNVEAAWIGSQINLFATAILGRIDQPHLHRETGAALNPSIAIADHYKMGASYYYGDGQSTTRNVVGPWFILGFTPHFFLLSEWDFQIQSDKNGTYSGRLGAVNYQRLDYEVIQGLHFYVTQDYSRLNFADQKTLRYSFGIGTQFFPRPHFEFNLSWQKQKRANISDDFIDFAWFMINFYL